MSSRGSIALVLVLGIGLLSACGEDQSADLASMSEPEKRWYDKAVNEAALRWYTSQDPKHNESVVDAFEERYPGVEVEELRLASVALGTRFAQEKDADARTADVVTVADKGVVVDGLEKGWWSNLDKREIPAARTLDAEFFDRGVATTLISPYGIGYNPDLVEDPPEDWPDILDPQYKGEIVFPDVRVSSAYIYHVRMWVDLYGRDYLEKLNAHDTITVDSMVPGVQQVANGQAEIALPLPPTTAAELMDSGAPLEIVYPRTMLGVDTDTAIAAGTPSPNAARLFYNFLLTEEGQKAHVGSSASSPVGVEGSIELPENYIRPDVDDIPPTLETAEQVLDLP